MTTRPVPCALALAFVIALVDGGAALADASPTGSALTERQAARVTPVVAVVQRALPSVVNIQTTRVVESRPMGRGAFGGFFPEIFDVPRQMTTNSVGSGSIIHASGYVLTNAHVVAQADELVVQLADGKKLPASLVAAIAEDDIAILKVEPDRPLPAVTLGRSDDLMVGETAIAIGNPVGLGHTVTTGIVSALDRELSPTRDVTFKGIIQSDAAINPGNSGGPLLNLLGEQIGVTTAIRADVQNVGFAIPVDRVKALLPSMLDVKHKGRLSLGLAIDDDAEGAARVSTVEKGSSAARAGLVVGARVLRVADRPIAHALDALVAIREQRPGKPFVVVTEHAGATREHTVAIVEVPPPDGSALAWSRFGLRLKPIDFERARKLRVRPESAIVVDDVAPSSEASRVGFKKGDLVTRIGPYGVRTVQEVGLVLEHVKPGDDVQVRVLRIEGSVVSQSDVVLTAR